MKRFIELFIIVTAVIFINKTAFAGTNIAYIKDGDIVFETTDTIATSGIRWSEVGFTLRRDRTGGNPVKDSKYGTLWLKEKYRSKKDNGDGTYRVSFTISKKDTETVLSEAGILKGKGDILYLNGIFKVIRYGKTDKKYYRTLSGIKGAAGWRNKKDFDELFDIKVVFKAPEPPEEKQEKEKIKKEGTGEAAPFAVIGAGELGNEPFDVTEGVPVEESLYCTGWTKEYIRSYEYKRVQGEKIYPVTVNRTYQLSWTEKRMVPDGNKGELKEISVPRSRSHTVSSEVYVKRRYSYWKIEDLYVGIPEQMLVYNGALPGEQVVMEPVNYEPPTVDYELYSKKEHIQEPSYNRILQLPTRYISGSDFAPEVPSENFQAYAESEIPEIRVRNDFLSVKGEVLMEPVWQEMSTENPKEFLEAGEQTKDFVFLKQGLYLPVKRPNGTYTSSGKVIYKPLIALKKENERRRTFPIEEINPVFVHTPVVCDGSVEDKYRECQMLFPDQERGALILGKSFQVTLSAEGHHRSILGYFYQDYSRYIKRRQVKFPFEVIYQGETKSSNSWVEIGENATFYLPMQVAEGKYRIEFRCVAKNGEIGDGEERWANLSEENYVARDWVDVEVSGQLRDFKVYDISDYPLWQKVFRKEKSLALTGFSFPVKSLPIKTGSHPYFSNIKGIKPGYILRMSCLTVGEMEDADAYVRIIPRFYYISEDLKQRQEVDVYYTETVEGKLKQLIKIGSEDDRNNVKNIRLGDTYLSIPTIELQKTAEKKQLQLKEFLQKEYKSFTFSNIMLSSQMQILCDTKGVQKWYFEYYLPSKLYITRKDFSLNQVEKRNKLNLQEEFWLKEGFLILNFDIETIRNGKRYLSYRNESMALQGYRNQWLYEKNGEITDPYALGDVAQLKLNQSAAIDYQSRGTH
ncbi:MAG: DUF5704 domain-containing protein [Acetivibrio ethanolgignens]